MAETQNAEQDGAGGLLRGGPRLSEILHMDYETRSAVDLKKTGIEIYARDKSTDIILLSYAFDEEPVSIWLPHMEPVPERIVRHINQGGLVAAWNAAFEIILTKRVAAQKYGFPEIHPEQTICEMAKAYAMQLPGQLGKAAPALGIEEGKDMDGKRTMLKMAKPRRVEPDGTIVWWDTPELWKDLITYGKQDVVVEREIGKRTLPLSEKEHAVWVLDQKINERGVYADVQAAKTARNVIAIEQERLNREMQRVTLGAVATCNSVSALTSWIESFGIEVPGVTKADVTDLLDKSDLPKPVRDALILRREAAKSSTAKVEAILTRVCEDGRIRNMFQYHGAAATGRWAGRGVQVQNLPRQTLDQSEINAIFQILDNLLDEPAEMIRDKLALMGEPMTLVSQCLRGMLRAPPGHELIACDFSAIEARGLAWLAGEERVLQVFRGHGKIYEHAASGIYGVPIENVTKDQRMIGKVASLALGYQGGVGAFQSMARAYGLQVEDERADQIKVAWRNAHPNITKYWKDLEDAAVNAVLYQGTPQKAGAKGREVTYLVKGSFLFCRLPSGRVICYPYPKIEQTTTPWGTEALKLTYMAEESFTGKWAKCSAYGGLLAENVCQAVCRDLLAEAMIRCEDQGYPIVMHIHDELVAEVAKGEGSVEEMASIMSEVPYWAADFPISAEGWRDERFRK